MNTLIFPSVTVRLRSKIRKTNNKPANAIGMIRRMYVLEHF